MSQVTLLFSIFAILIVFSSLVQAQNGTSLSYSPKSITKAMDLAVKTNSLSYIYSEGSTTIMDSSNIQHEQFDSLKLRNPDVAVFLAVVPGFVVHGLGHFYADKPMTGMALLALGFVGGMMMIEGSAHLGFFRGPEGSGASGSQTGYTIELLGGVALFFGSWVFDITRAPQIIERRNERLLYKGKIN